MFCQDKNQTITSTCQPDPGIIAAYQSALTTPVEQADSARKRLVLRYADGRIPCNCGLAYAGCAYGCQSAIIAATNEITRRAEMELTGRPDRYLASFVPYKGTI